MNDAQAIRETISAWLAASKEGDAGKLASILDDDVLFVVVGRPAFGKKEFLAGSPGKPHLFNAVADVQEVVVNGDWALTRVHLSIEMAMTKDAKTMRLAGPTTSVWRRSTTGDWLIWRDANMVAPVG